MSVTEEEGGRLNAFAKEPRMEVIDNGSSKTKGSWFILLGGAILLGSLIAVTLGIS